MAKVGYASTLYWINPLTLKDGQLAPPQILNSSML